MICVVAVLAALNVLLSPEIAAAFVVGWTTYAILEAWTDWRLLVVSLLALVGTATGCYFLLPPAYYNSLLLFSRGANNLPLVPAVHLVLYIVTLALFVPPLLSAYWHRPRDAAFLASLGVLSVAMMPGALGRCDLPHVLFYGLIPSLLLLIGLANVSRKGYIVYTLAYAVVFIGMMRAVDLTLLLNVTPKELATQPLKMAHRFAGMLHGEFSPRDYAYLSALDKYPRVGLPFATYGDKAAEDYLFAHHKVEPEYYVGLVGVYSEAELNLKLSETGIHEFLLVKKGWDRPNLEGSADFYIADLRKRLLYPANLQVVRHDIDAVGEVNRFITSHYHAIEEVGPSVIVQKTHELNSSSDASKKFE
jgi:hypothetical protein